MKKLGALLLALVLTSGCELVWVVPPADGRVLDARSRQPVVRADVTRLCDDAPAKTKTDAQGYFSFHGKRTLQVAIGDTLSTPATYRIEITGYQITETNGFAFGWANQSGLRHNLGEILLAPK